MIHSVTFFGVCENIGLDMQGKPTAFLPTELPRKVLHPGLQKVHRWKDKDDGRAHTPERASYNHIRFIQ